MPLNQALDSNNAEMTKRLKYTKDILTHMLNNNQQQNPTAVGSRNPTSTEVSGTPTSSAGGLQLNSNSSRRAVGAPALAGLPPGNEVPMNGFGSLNGNGTQSNPGLQTMSSIQ